MIKESHVFIENYIPGKLSKYGLSYDDLKEINPNLVYASLSGWGQEGKYSSRAGYDVIAASFGGLLSITGDENPARVGVAVTDLFTGSLCSSAILAAILRVNQGDGGSWIQSSLLHSQSAMLSHISAAYLTSGIDGKRYGTAHPSLVPYQSFKTLDDKYLTIGAGNNIHFEKLCSILELPHLPTDPKFAQNAQRVAHRVELISILSERLNQKTRADWMKLFEQGANFPFGPVNTVSEAYSDEEYKKTIINFDQTNKRESISVPGSPILFGNEVIDKPRPAPSLGQDTTQVLKELGYSHDQIEKLKNENIIQCQ
jgi:succinate--hydroxymethylglutarate CoA-transferase